MSLLETAPNNRVYTRDLADPHDGAAGKPAPTAPRCAADPRDVSVELVPAAACSRLLPDWRGLADRALQPNPFMAPEFLLPAAMHLSGSKDLVLACVWKSHPRSRELIGLFALAVPRARGFSWRQADRSALWAHSTVPLGTPLLSQDPAAAAAALSAFITSQRRGGLPGLSFPSVEAGSGLMALLAEAAISRGLTVSQSPDATHSRGLDINLTREPETSGVMLAQDPASLRAMLEQALAMDAAMPRETGSAPPVIYDASRLAFLRAVIRGFAQTGQIIMARLNDGSRKAVAIAVIGPDRAYLWQLFGPSAREPGTEAALTCAIRAALSKPVAAATAHPVAGFCTMPLRTQTIVLG
jgi:hypothetical protein